MFLKSLKPKINFAEKRSNSFKSSGVNLKPTKEKKVVVYNENVIQSKLNERYKFTNYYSDRTDAEIMNRLDALSSDLNIIKECDLEDTINFNDDRIAEIIKLFITDFDVNDLEADEVGKVSLKDSFGKNTGVRVYFIVDSLKLEYKVILIDIFHLVIPSQHTTKKGRKIDREKMLNTTFNENRSNNKCISDCFNY